ncbi:uncharacterized protein PG986_010502 [Apiospora aurea]|uniref:Uncharacterized protein n=1 Tax=Apiospora aurea TaxID=335848 RepID=A0ABR1Q2V9_9PEZI
MANTISRRKLGSFTKNIFSCMGCGATVVLHKNPLPNNNTDNMTPGWNEPHGGTIAFNSSCRIRPLRSTCLKS